MACRSEVGELLEGPCELQSQILSQNEDSGNQSVKMWPSRKPAWLWIFFFSCPIPQKVSDSSLGIGE